MATKRASVIYCGHSTVIVETEQGKRMIIDPFLDGNPLCPEELKRDPGKIDYILLTHGHSDHTGSAVSLAKKTNATVFATWELANLLTKEGVDAKNMQYMNKGGTVNVPDGKGLSVTFTHAFHSSSFDASDGTTYYAGEPCGIVITLESGRCIYHAGDTALFGDMELIGEMFKPVLAFLPIGDRFTMGPRDAAKASELIGAKFAVPVHFATFDMLSGRPEEFAELLSGGQTKAVTLKPGERFEF